MATGQLPFRGDSSATIFDSILNCAPVPPIRLNPNLPVEIERIVNKALEKDRNLRYQHAFDIRTDLQRLKRASDSARAAVATREAELEAGCQQGSSENQFKISRRAAVAALAGAASTAGVATWYFWPRPAKRLMRVNMDISPAQQFAQFT
jgi:serine/threonine protein kinase